MAIRFDASGDYLRRTTDLPGQNPLTITFWWYPIAHSDGAGFAAIHSASKYLGWAYQSAAECPRLVMDNTAIAVRAYGDTPVNNWYFCSIVYDDDSNEHGDIADEAESISLHALTQYGDWTPTGLSLGQIAPNSDFYDCRIAYVKIWTAALTVTQINAEMFHSDPQVTANVHLYSYLDDKDDLADKSGNGRTWTAGGTLTTEDSPAGVTRDAATGGGIAWGVAAPDSPEVATSWTNWEVSNGVPATISGHADYGDVELTGSTPIYSNVADMGDASSKTITVTQNKYGAAGGAYTLEIRGSATTFAKWDGSPSFSAYSAPVSQAWRYVQLKLTRA